MNGTYGDETLILSQGFLCQHLLLFICSCIGTFQAMFAASNVRFDLNDYCGMYVCVHVRVG